MEEKEWSEVSIGIFAEWQPQYADFGIATYPVEFIAGSDGKFDKKPAVRAYDRIGLPYSKVLATSLSSANGFAFQAGARSRISVLDIDSPSEKVLADSLDRHGRTPILVRTGSGNHQAWYRHNGEGRKIRAFGPDGPPLDILGKGVVVAPPSRRPDGNGYQFIQGGLGDLPALPTLRNLPEASNAPTIAPNDIGEPQTIPEPHRPTQGRNNTLWRFCMRQAHGCSDFNALLDIARAGNSRFIPPMDDQEICKVAQSAWQYTERGENRFGQHGAWFPIEEVMGMTGDADAFLLLAFLRAHNGPWAKFMVTNSLADKFGWDRRRLAAARHRLIEMQYLKPIRQAGRGHPALFQWVY